MTLNLLGRMRLPRALPRDLALIALLIGLDVIARLSPHAPDFTPVAVTGLFAASVIRVRALALLVPVAAMALADTAVGFYDAKLMAVVYAALALPAGAAWLSARLRRPLMIAPVLLSSALMFFLVTNFAVWLLSPMYPITAAGLIRCYVAALPFLRNMIEGDLFWGLALFGGYWLLQALAAPRTETAGMVCRRP